MEPGIWQASAKSGRLTQGGEGVGTLTLETGRSRAVRIMQKRSPAVQETHVGNEVPGILSRPLLGVADTVQDTGATKTTRESVPSPKSSSVFTGVQEVQKDGK